MTVQQFNLLANECFGHTLAPYGFTNDRSKQSTFHRRVSETLYHFIAPDLGTRGAWYDIRVFPHSPYVYPLFQHRFPDDLGIPTDRFSDLSEKGVGVGQQQFTCKTEESFRRGFESQVRPLLVQIALPYLDQFKTVKDMIPAIRHSSFLGFALHHAGRTSEAVVELRKERERLLKLDTANEDVQRMLQKIDELLASQHY